MVTLDRILSCDIARDLADTAAIERAGKALPYEPVGRIAVVGQRISAWVSSDYPYFAEIGVDADTGELRYRCSCSQGDEAGFCEHCVALTRCWEGQGSPVGLRDSELREYLAGHERQELIDLIVALATANEQVDVALQAKIAAGRKPELDFEELERLFATVLTVPGYLRHEEFRVVIHNASSVVELLGGALEHADAKMAAAAVRFLAQALKRLDDFLDWEDMCEYDDGILTDRLVGLHAEACRKSGIDPEELAESLLKDYLTHDYWCWRNPLESHGAALGGEGLERLRQQVENCWNGVERMEEWRHPEEGSRRHPIGEGQVRLKRLMIAFAQATDDVDRLVEIEVEDTLFGVDYERIVGLLNAAGREREALEWAQRGMEGDRYLSWSRLPDLAVEMLQSSGRPDDAAAVRLKQFLNWPSVESLEALREVAEGLESWPRIRAEAIESVSTLSDDAEGHHRHASELKSVLTDILSREGDVDDASA